MADSLPKSTTKAGQALSLPLNWPSLGKALALIERSISQGQSIAVWGHDDLDGIASTAIMMDALRGRTNTLYYIPPKRGTHYGLDISVIDELVRKQVGLVITVDGGISSYQEAEYCRSLGLPLIITDHHELPEKLPPATALVNPKIDEQGRPFPNLAGAGVSLFLASAVSGFNELGWHLRAPRRLAWASLATVSDRVPLTEDNRVLLRDGMPCIPEDHSLLDMAGIMGLDLANGLSPFIIQNSFAGLFSASVSEGFRHPGVEILLGNVDKVYIAGLWENQQDWKERFGKYSQKALSSIKAPDPVIITLVEESLPPDMIGPLAGALRDKLGWPSVVIGHKSGRLVGECRGYLPFDFVSMLRQMGHRFVQFGGHKQAAGFTVAQENLEHVLSDISHYSDQSRFLIEKSRPRTDIEFEAGCLDDLKKLGKVLQERAPFGPHNPMPACRIRNASLPDSFNAKGHCWIEELAWPGPVENNGQNGLAVFLDITHLGKMLLSAGK